MKKGLKRASTLLIAGLLAAASITGCSAPGGTSSTTDTPSAADTASGNSGGTAEEEKGDPFMKFDEPVEIHIGQMAQPTMSFPEGDTNEDNVYTRYLLDNFNIKVVVDWSAASGNDYSQKVSLCIASNTLPDGMSCGRKDFLAAAKSDMLYDFTDLFPQYASPQVLAIMESGDNLAYEYSMYEGRQLCMVGVDVSASGRSVVNVRQDWLDELGLEPPKTLDDIEEIAIAFRDAQPGGEGTIPIAGPDKNGSACYSNFLANGVASCGFEPVFAAYDAYPGWWVEDENGKVEYGTLSEGSRKAFERLADWYAKGLIDPEMGVRDSSDEAINSGKTGMYFCAWWKMGYGITDAYHNDPHANWQAYTVYTDDGQWNTREQCPVGSYVICNKNISEDVAKAAIIMNNVWIRDENKLTTDYGQNTSIYWYPLRNSMALLDECEVTYHALYDVLNGEATAEDYNETDSPMKLLYNDCLSLETGIKDYEVGSNTLSIENFNIEDPNFPRLYSILAGDRPCAIDTPDKSVYSVCYSQTETMESKWANLETAENEMGLRIITGKDDISAFDAFVDRWYAEGGTEITAEVQAMADAD